MLKRMQGVTGRLDTLYSLALRLLGRWTLAVTEEHTNTHGQYTSWHRHAYVPPQRRHRVRPTGLQEDTQRQVHDGQGLGF